MPDPEILIERKLHLAGTRPAMFAGFWPWDMTVVLGVLTVELGIRNWKLMLLALPFWAGGAWMVRRDYNAPRRCPWMSG